MSAVVRESLVDRIKRDVRLLDVAGDYAAEIKRRGRLHVCRCICGQNSDRTPSFMLYDDNHYHCYACQRHGSVIDLVMLVENLDFKSAVEFLRHHYLPDQDRDVRPRHTTRPQSRPAATQFAISDEVKAVLDAATRHYQSALLRTPMALDYLHARGLTDETIQQLKIGFADGGLGRALFAQGLDMMLAARAGLISPRGEFLHGRVVFPVLDARGATEWVIGRAVMDDDSPKYLGLPESLVHKQPMVMGTARRGSIWVEGAFDFATLVQWGLAEKYLLIGMLGTAYESIVHRLLPRVTPHAIVCTDQDLAGKQAGLKLAMLMRERGIRPAMIADADRHKLISAWVTRVQKKTDLSDDEREKLLKGQGELAAIQELSTQHLIRWVEWGNQAKDPGDLCKMGDRGRQRFLGTLPD